MTQRIAMVALLLATIASSCGADTAATGQASDAPIPTSAVASSNLQVIKTQLAAAASDGCPLISASDVADILGEATPLRTRAMSEASGPACGFPHPRQGGYILVLQLQPPTRWSEYQKIGQEVVGLGFEAQLVSASKLYVRDEARHVVLMILAPDGDVSSSELLRIASRIYGASPDSVRARYA